MSTKIKKEDIERLKNLALEAMRENATNRASLKLKHPNTRPNDIKEDIATAERVVEKNREKVLQSSASTNEEIDYPSSYQPSSMLTRLYTKSLLILKYVLIACLLIGLTGLLYKILPSSSTGLNKYDYIQERAADDYRI